MKAVSRHILCFIILLLSISSLQAEEDWARAYYKQEKTVERLQYKSAEIEKQIKYYKKLTVLNQSQAAKRNQ